MTEATQTCIARCLNWTAEVGWADEDTSWTCSAVESRVTISLYRVISPRKQATVSSPVCTSEGWYSFREKSLRRRDQGVRRFEQIAALAARDC